MPLNQPISSKKQYNVLNCKTDLGCIYVQWRLIITNRLKVLYYYYSHCTKFTAQKLLYMYVYCKCKLFCQALLISVCYNMESLGMCTHNTRTIQRVHLFCMHHIHAYEYCTSTIIMIVLSRSIAYYLVLLQQGSNMEGFDHKHACFLYQKRKI